MALPTSGAISLSQIGYEAKYAYFSTVSIDWTALRRLPNKMGAGSMISFADFRGTAHGVGPGYLARAFVNLANQVPGTVPWSNEVVLEGLPDGGVTAAFQGAAAAKINGISRAIDSVFSVKNGDTVQLCARVPAALLAGDASQTAKVIFSTGAELAWTVSAFRLVLKYLKVSHTVSGNNRSISVSTVSSDPGTGVLFYSFASSIQLWSSSITYIGAEVYPAQYTTTDDVLSASGSHSSSSAMADASWWRTFNVNVRVRGVAYTRMSLFTEGQVDFWNPQ